MMLFGQKYGMTFVVGALVSLGLAMACGSSSKPPAEPPHVEVTASQPAPATSASAPIVAAPAPTGAPAEPPPVRHDGRG